MKHFTPMALLIARTFAQDKAPAIAEHLGVSLSTYYGWEKGTQTPSHEQVEKLAKRLYRPVTFFKKMPSIR